MRRFIRTDVIKTNVHPYRRCHCEERNARRGNLVETKCRLRTRASRLAGGGSPTAGGFLRCVRVKTLTSVEMTSSTIDRFKAFPLGGRCRVATDEGKRPYTVGVHSLPVGEPPMASRLRTCLQNNFTKQSTANVSPKGKALISRTQPTQNTRRKM